MEQKEELQQTAPAVRHQNDHLSVVIHIHPDCRIEFEIDATPSLIKPAYDRAVKAVAKEVSLPGFRKGKAPTNLVEKNHPKQIEKAWQEAVAESAFKEAHQLAQTPLLNNEPKISYSFKSLSHEAAKLSVFFETEPSVPTIDPKHISLKAVERPLVNEKKVEETIRQLLFFFAQWTDITDRPVQEGDFVILDVDLIEETPPKNLFSKVRFEVSDTSMAKWMKDLVLGQETGAVLEGVSVPDADASKSDQETLGPKKVRVTLHKIETAFLPQLDDQFAKNLGAASVEVMRSNITNLLNKQADDHVQEKLREQMSEHLVSHVKFDIPKSLIEREMRYRMHQLLQDQEYLSFWNRMTQEARKRTVSSVAEQSEKAVRMFYICRKVLKDAQIQVSAKDIPRPPKDPLNLLLNPSRSFDPQEKNEMHQAEAFSRLLLEKAEDYLIQNATLAQ